MALAGFQVTIYQAKFGARELATTTSDHDGNFTVKLRTDPVGGIVYAIARKGSKVELMSLVGKEIPDRITLNEMTTVSSAYAMARLLRDGMIPAAPPLPVEVAVGMARNLVSVANGTPSSVIKTSPNADETNAWRLLGTLSNILAPCVRGSGEACGRLFALTIAAGEAAPKTTLQAAIGMARHPASNVRPLFKLAQLSDAYAPHLEAAQGPDAPDKRMRLDALTLAVKFNATGTTDPKTGRELCPFGGAANVAFDLDGTAWITNNVVQGTGDATNCMVVLKPDGRPSDGARGTPRSPVFGGGVLGQGYGLGFDPKGTLWSGNFGWGGINPTDKNGQPGGGVSRSTGRGKPLSPSYGYTGNVYRVQGTVSDKAGNIWLAGFGNDVVQVFPNGDPNASAPSHQDYKRLPFDVRIDSENAGWVTYNGTPAVAKFVFTPASGLRRPTLERRFVVPLGPPTTSGHPEHITGGPKGVAIDSLGNAWVAHGDDNAVFAIDINGNMLGKFGGGGINGPWGVSLDSDQTVWVANFGRLGPTDIKFRVSHLCGAVPSKCPAGVKPGEPISPETGYTLPSGGAQVLLHNGEPLYGMPTSKPSFDPLMRVTSVNVDMAGNVWCTNNWKPSWANDAVIENTNPGGDGVVIFVGLGAPVQPVLYSAPPISPFSPFD